MPVGFDPGDPRGGGISPIEAEDGTGRAPRISFLDAWLARAEFPYDPFDYGRRCPTGPMRWTPPPEGEEVPRCPA